MRRADDPRRICRQGAGGAHLDPYHGERSCRQTCFAGARIVAQHGWNASPLEGVSLKPNEWPGS